MEKASIRRVVEMLVGEGLRGRHLAFTTSRLGRISLRRSLRLHERMRRQVHAQPFLSGIANECLRVYRPAQVIVQVGALGHANQEGVQFQGIPTGGFQGEGRALLRSSGACGRFNGAPCCFLGRQRLRPEKNQSQYKADEKRVLRVFVHVLGSACGGSQHCTVQPQKSGDRVPLLLFPKKTLDSTAHSEDYCRRWFSVSGPQIRIGVIGR